MLSKSVLKGGVGEKALAYQIQPQLNELSKPGCGYTGVRKLVTKSQKAARSGIPFQGGALQLLRSGPEVQGVLLAPQLNPSVCELCFQNGNFILSPLWEELDSFLVVVTWLCCVHSRFGSSYTYVGHVCQLLAAVQTLPARKGPCLPPAVLQLPTFTGPDSSRAKHSYSLIFRTQPRPRPH